MPTEIAITMTATGPVPTPPATLLAELLAVATSLSPGLTANLPGSLIDDISGTQVGGLSVMDSGVVDLINSISPLTANPTLCNQLGQVYGVQPGQGYNTSVYVVFSGPAGFLIPIGFAVSDGTYQYVVQDGGIIATGGTTAPLYCLASIAGTWPVPASTVTTLLTSVPTGISVTCTNPTAGVPGIGAQPIQSYQADVIQGGLAECVGVPAMLKTLLRNVIGVQSRLVSVRLPTSGQWEVIVGGGDPYQVGAAIFAGIGDISSLVGSSLDVTAITNASPGKVTTNLNHGFTTGQVINIAGTTGISGINNTPLTITVVDEKTFTIGINTTSSGSYTGGGIVTPNLRNLSVSINDYPDTYVIPFVNPPQQVVTVALTWNTISTNYASPAAIAQLGNAAILAYINSIAVGQPINGFEIEFAFQQAIAALIPPALLSRMVLVITINGVTISPTSGTELYVGDPESYFFCTAADISIIQG